MERYRQRREGTTFSYYNNDTCRLIERFLNSKEHFSSYEEKYRNFLARTRGTSRNAVRYSRKVARKFAKEKDAREYFWADISKKITFPFRDEIAVL